MADVNALIVCGGLSTRLGDITKDIPKILLPIKGKTVLEWQLAKLQRLGVDTVVLAAGHLSQVLRAAVGERWHGVNLVHAVENERLGTGGAIQNAWQHVPHPGLPTVIFNGDILTTIDLTDMHHWLRPQSQGIILGSRVDSAAAYGTLEHDARYRLLSFKEKEGKEQPGYINGGIYIFTERAREVFPETKSFSIEYEAFPFMNDLDVYASDKPWIDIGVPERLAWAQEHWPEN